MFPAMRDAMLMDRFPSLAEGARRVGVEALELALAPDLTLPDPAGPGRLPVWDAASVDAYRAALDAAGLRACALLTAQDYGAGGADEHVPWLARAVEVAGGLGAAALRVDPLMRREADLGFDERVARVADVVAGAIARTPDSPVALAIENHGHGGNSPVFLLSVLQAVGHPRAGLTLDTGNFYWRGFPRAEVQALVRIFAPHTRHTHLKNIRFPEAQRDVERPAGWEYGACACGLAAGDLDLARVVADLRAAGYDGALCVENEALGKESDDDARVALLASDVAHVRGLLG